MKLSLAWIFDHIDADWKQQDVDAIIAKFNRTTAEIESHYRIVFDLHNFFLGTVIKKNTQGVKVFIKEREQTIDLPFRVDASVSESKCHYLIKKEGESFYWATKTDFGAGEGFLSSLDATEDELAGAWREKFEQEDVILEVDNKSITHRPDMWGHRGFAREIAAFLNLPLHDPQKFLKQHPVIVFSGASEPTSSTNFIIQNQALQACKRFVGLCLHNVKNKSSNLFLASRLLKVGVSPYDALVDLTNYVMLDWSQPMHAYDADKIDKKNIVIRMAHEGEKLLLLNEDRITLASQDLVIADAEKPICLAGVKGGLISSISSTTTSAFLEAANFDAGVVRKTAQRYKIRTDSSARFEKTLDPNQTVQAMQRFLKLAEDIELQAQPADEIISLGKDEKIHVIEVEHDFLERRAGITFDSSRVINILTRLEFHVIKSTNQNKKIVYLISVPSFRANKDIKIKEDIVEEVVRSYGFENITPELPRLLRTSFDMSYLLKEHRIKYFLSYAVGMTEQQNYSLYDEQFIASLGYAPETVVSLINPVSQNYSRMVGSLLPALLKNIKENHVQQDKLAFFEMGRIWQNHQDAVVERKSIAGIFFKKRTNIDFYEYKFMLHNLFKMLGFDPSVIMWQKLTQQVELWYRPFLSASLWYDNKVLGYAGKIDPVLISKLDIGVAADAFLFELDADFLQTYKVPLPHYHPLSKYQETFFDVSLFVPLAVEAAALEKDIYAVNTLIKQVQLIDFFEQPEPAAASSAEPARALTFRVTVSHDEKTLEKAEIDLVWQQVVTKIQERGVKVRM